MINEQGAAATPGERDHRRHHFNAGAQRIEQIGTGIESGIRRYNIVPTYIQPVVGNGSDISAANPQSGITEAERDGGIPADSYFNDILIPDTNVAGNISFNMFIVRHHPILFTMGVIIFWDHQAPDGIQLPVARIISQILDMPVEVRESPILLRGFNRQRNQHNARTILDGIQDKYTRVNGTDESLLLVVGADLCIPGCDFIFGLARAGINAAIISTARLGNGYYGRKHRDDDIIDRVVKEGAHEIGHLFGLTHCDDPECIMFLPETLDDLDGKKKMLCPLCQEHLDARRDEGKKAETAPAASEKTALPQIPRGRSS